MKPVFEYDPVKSRRNKAKHGLDFVEAQELWTVTHVIFPAREISGEIRQIIVGEIRDRLYIGVFTHRGIAIRLMSCHRADVRWSKEYEEALREKKEH